jgi:hypothetical protein
VIIKKKSQEGTKPTWKKHILAHRRNSMAEPHSRPKESFARMMRNHSRLWERFLAILADNIYFKGKTIFSFLCAFEYTKDEGNIKDLKVLCSRFGAVSSYIKRTRHFPLSGLRFSFVKWGTRIGRVGGQKANLLGSFSVLRVYNKWDNVELCFQLVSKGKKFTWIHYI